MIVTLFGVPGNMGTRVVETLIDEEYITRINLLVHDKKGIKQIIKKLKKSNKEYKIVYGTVANVINVSDAIGEADYVINMAAVIPPKSDKEPTEAIEANEIGPKVIVRLIEAMKEKQPKLIHISTIGVYGDRNYKHPYAEVGDPLLISPFDIYSLTKMRGELTVLESNIKHWTVIRQTAMLYDELMFKNISDGLMFHTCFNSLLEWATAKDSALLIRNILRRDTKGELNEDNFWKHCFNIGGGIKNRVTGFDTYEIGFNIIGGKVEKFFDPNYNSLRNFHGEWYSDFDKLNDLFDYQHDNIRDFWQNVLKTHKYFGLAKLTPAPILKAMIFKPLLKDDNAPMYWYNNNDEAKMLAYFNGKEKYEAIPKKWSDFNLIINGKAEDGSPVDYQKLLNNPTRLEHFFDIDKDRKLIDIDDLRRVAEAHGGKLLTDDFKTGDIYRKVKWMNCDGEEFEARPHSVLFCGHWKNISYTKYAWDFDRLAKLDKTVAQIWYDAHEKDEDRYYWYDSHFNARYKKLGE